MLTFYDIFFQNSNDLSYWVCFGATRLTIFQCVNQIINIHHLWCYFLAYRSYCPFGSGAAIACPAGSYGSETSLNTSACSGLCTAGVYTRLCMLRSRSRSSELVIFLSQVCVYLSYMRPGSYGSTLGLTSPACSGLCARGCCGNFNIN